MLTLITGGCKCGKSSIAEDILSDFCGRKIYIATMEPFGEEAHTAISRHRIMRSGKGFETVEKYTDIQDIDLPDGCAVLLECACNLDVLKGREIPCAEDNNRNIKAFRSCRPLYNRYKSGGR